MSRPNDLHVEARSLRFERGGRRIFDDLSCGFPRDQISVLLGGSGAGKSTLLRMLGCLSKPDSGDIWINGEVELTCMPDAQARRFRRNIGMMFQGGALLDSMSVYDNVALPLREHSKKSEAEIREEVQHCFAAVGLREIGDKLLPGQLSGGMMKRAALARALIMAPELLLCDEPFSGLDPQTVLLVEDLLGSVSRDRGVTMIVTSHHMESTLRMARHIVVLHDGRAIEGSPDELLARQDPVIQGFFSEARGAISA